METQSGAHCDPYWDASLDVRRSANCVHQALDHLLKTLKPRCWTFFGLSIRFQHQQGVEKRNQCGFRRSHWPKRRGYEGTVATWAKWSQVDMYRPEIFTYRGSPFTYKCRSHSLLINKLCIFTINSCPTVWNTTFIAKPWTQCEWVDVCMANHLNSM